MHILLALLGLIGVAVLWWYRLKRIHGAASEAADAAGRLRGAYRRHRIRKSTEMSPLTAIDDPILAAATVILAIVSEDDPLTDTRLSALTNALAGVSDSAKATDAVTYAKWATGEITQATTAIDKVGPFLRATLNATEKTDLLAMLDHVAAAGPRPPLYRQRVSRLRVKLGLTVA